MAALLNVIAAIVTAWLTWYIYRFFISPQFRPGEPEELPYSIPIVGHVLSMFTNSHRLFERGWKSYNGAPWALTMGGETVYVISKPEDVQEAFRASKSLDYDETIKSVLAAYGVTDRVISESFKINPGKNKNYIDETTDNFKAQLHPGPKLDILQNKIMEFLDRSMRWDNIHGNMILEDGDDKKVVSLYDWCEVLIVDAQTRALLGDDIFQLCPDILAQFQIFENEGWKLFAKLPSIATKKLRSAQQYMVDGFKGYFDLPKEGRSGMSWIIETMENGLDGLGCNSAEKAATVFSIVRTMNANAYKAIFWIICYALFDPSLLAELKEEIQPAFQGSPQSMPNLDYIFESCPLLASTCEEIIRLTTWSMGVRTVKSDLIIGGKMLRAGKGLMMPFRIMNYDPTVFGTDAGSFNPRRFMKTKNLVKSSSYRPFGGGSHYCPGRFLARREAQMVTAVVLKRFDISLVGPKGQKAKFPRMDETLPSGGIQLPAKGEDLVVRIRPAT